MSTTEDRSVDLEPGDLGIDLLSADDGTPVLLLSGEIDAATVGRLVSCFDALARTNPRRIAIGFGDVTFMDSSGVNAVLELRRRLGNGARVVLRDCSVVVRRVCDITGLAEADGILVA
jgi:stage II sporulation protein AA (anti-sigma F factor antagonist)